MRPATAGTVAGLLAEAGELLRRAGVDSPEWDAERLLRHVLGWDRAATIARADSTVAPGDEARFRKLVALRAGRRPLQHILGTQPFWRHDFLVTPDVLVPRPETELLVERALERLRIRKRPLVVDVGTGSGCIALSLAAERTDAEVHATDISAAALRVARENARRLGLDGRVVFHLGDLLEPVVSLAGRIDLVVSNPPYVDPDDRVDLPPEVRDHDPEVALFAEEHGLAVYRRLVPAASLIRPGGHLLLEVSPAVGSSVARIAAEGGLEDVRLLPDLAGRPRAVEARRPPVPSPAALK